MSYPQALIVKLLQTFIKVNADTSNEYLQVIPHQKLDSVLLLNALKKADKGQIYYLLESEETIYHALVITYDNNKAKCNYIYVNEALLTLETLQTCFKMASIKPIFSITPLKLDSANMAIGFTEALYQLLTQDKITALDIRSAFLKHHQICQDAAISQLNKLKDELIQLEPPLRLLFLYDNLIALIRSRELKSQEYIKEKIRFYKIKNINTVYYLKPLSYEILFAIIDATSLQDLLVFLHEKCIERLKKLLQAEQEKFPKATNSQKFTITLHLFYDALTLGIYGGLATQLSNLIQWSLNNGSILAVPLAIAIGATSANQLPNVAQRLLTNLSTLTASRIIIKNITVADFLKAMSLVAGSYLLKDAKLYPIIKPVIIHYASGQLAKYMHSEGFNDKTGEAISPYISYTIDIENWRFLILSLLLLIEVLYFPNARQPVYTILAIATHLLFSSLIKKFLPTSSYEHIISFIFISIFSRTLSNSIGDYIYQVLGHQAACTEADKQLKELIGNGTVALQTECSSAWVPNYFKNGPKLTALATNKLSETYEIICDAHEVGPQKISDCNVTAVYKDLLTP